jgi:hypothetical protein
MLAVVCFILVLASAECWSVEPTLARLSFWVPQERMAEFETTYRAQVLPILKGHGLNESSEHGRTTVDSVFSRLFLFNSAAEVATKAEILQGDPAWQAVLKDLGTAFGTVAQDSLIRQSFRTYTSPAHPGEIIPAGPGTGQWHAYGMADGLPEGFVRAILQDRDGYLWFGTEKGVSRHDGHTFTNLPTEGGRARNAIHAMTQDREGNLWFNTRGGVSRYDGQDWKTFTTEDGLIHNAVLSIFQDREGHVWFGSKGGVNRYDGQTFTAFTIEDGLAYREMATTFQDRYGVLWFVTFGGGVSRYDGKTFTNFTTEDGLCSNLVSQIL